VFLVGGVDVLDDSGLKDLRDALNADGFSQVYYGHPHHSGWFGREMRRIASEDPAARFVLVGFEVGAVTAGNLAADGCRHGLNVEGLVLLDPIRVPSDASATSGMPVHVVGSGRWVPPDGLTDCVVTKLPDDCHFSIAAAPPTVALTADLLRSAVERVPADAIPATILPMIDDPAPIPQFIPDPVTAPKGKSPATSQTARSGPARWRESLDASPAVRLNTPMKLKQSADDFVVEETTDVVSGPGGEFAL
jgi:hypothetical protein